MTKITKCYAKISCFFDFLHYAQRTDFFLDKYNKKVATLQMLQPFHNTFTSR